ncbi:ABC transporter ATP-binding protein [Actinophytocola sp.]|uniref:ABC transporter ATP-binding protein n=1 Tax=Actinophytocola sp. TaxID=1872138 RepID=UPI003D6B93CC
MLKFENLDVSYGLRAALRDVTISVGAGEIVAVLGANGAGKTTLLNTMSGIVRSSSGRIVFDGQDVTSWQTFRRVTAGIVHCPEGRHVFAGMTVEENLIVGAYRRPAAGRTEALERVYALFPALVRRRSMAAGVLSGGEQQMVAIGRSLMARPRLLALDEPSLGLAPYVIEEMYQAILEIRRSEELSMLLVEQNAAAALDVADRGYVIESGSIRLSGTGPELAGDPRVRAAYLGG